MKIAVLYDSKFGNTKQLAEYMVDKIQAGGHEAQVFRTKKTKPKELLTFQPKAFHLSDKGSIFITWQTSPSICRPLLSIMAHKFFN